MKYFYFLIVMLLMVVSITSCKPAPTSKPNVSAPTPQYKVVNRFAHDPEAFTQGLEYDGSLIMESTGQRGTSWISQLDPADYSYEKKIILDGKYFGEGMTILGEKIYQLTYKSKKGFVYDRSSFELQQEFDYDKMMREGWGLTTDGTSLIASDGTSNLYFIDPTDFTILKTLPITNGTSKVPRLNELEYVNGDIYANVWQTPQILKINLESGAVVKTYDLSDLERSIKTNHPNIDVLNGIAYNETKETFLITGKYWPYYYELRLDK